MAGTDDGFDRFFDSMEALADTLSECLQSQVTIEDENHHVIAYSSHPFESDPARISTIIGKRVPQPVIAGLRSIGILRQLEQSPQPVWVSAVDEIGLGPRLAVCIRHRHEVLGYIWALDTGNLAHGPAERVMEQAAKAAARYLLKQRGWKTKQERMRDEWFWRLLTSHYESGQRIAEDAEVLSIRLAVPYYVGVLETGIQAEETMLFRLRRAAGSQQGVHLLAATAERNRFILLFSPEGPFRAEAAAAYIRRLADRLRMEEGARVTEGCSAGYETYVRASAAYREALTVAELRARLPFHSSQFILFEELGFLAYLPAIIEAKRSAGCRPSPLIAPLKAYDDEHKGDFLKSIAIYLSMDGNLKEAAAFLHIHTNTLIYRLNRIAEITGRHLKDAHYRTSLYLDLLTEEADQVNAWLAEGSGTGHSPAG